MTILREQEGYVPVDGYRVWYRSVGGGSEHNKARTLPTSKNPISTYKRCRSFWIPWKRRGTVVAKPIPSACHSSLRSE